jgi:LCP family protein required for cell wall assembly
VTNSSHRKSTKTPAATVARHAQLPHRQLAKSIAKTGAIALAILVVSSLSLGAIVLQQISNNVQTVTLPGELNAPTVAPGVGPFEGGFNMLIVGSDECVDTGGCPDRTEKLNDFTMLLHVAADHKSAVAVSFPRDLIVPIPACPRADGKGNYNSMSAQQINVTLQYGGLPCTAVTVRALTGLSIPFAGIMTFNGVREISTALGGVPVCIDAPIHDSYSGLNLPKAGTYNVEGEQALQFLRSRHGVGDGSDTGRIGSQQAFLASMMRKIKDGDTLTNVPKLFKLATAASENMTVSDNLRNVSTLASMAMVMKNIPLEAITFVKYPTGTQANAPGRVFPVKAAAADLFAKISADKPVGIDRPTNPVGTVALPSATPSATPPSSTSPTPGASPSASPSSAVIPGATGQTAADQVCTKANHR